MAQATNRAFADERRTAIMEMLEHNASVQVAEIAQTFGVSSVTARADLDALAEAGKLRRTHGGAVSLHKRLTVSTQDRRINVNVAAKQAIAQSAIELVNDGDTLLVDSGTTALEFVRLLDQRDGITVITADITIADYIDESMIAQGTHGFASGDMGDLSLMWPIVEIGVAGFEGSIHGKDFKTADPEQAYCVPAHYFADTVADLLSDGGASAWKIKEAFKPVMNKKNYLETLDSLNKSTFYEKENN